MAYVNITALSFPPGAQAEIERRFGARKKAVDAAAGFQGFELLRPTVGEDRYFVVTRWILSRIIRRGLRPVPPAVMTTTSVVA